MTEEEREKVRLEQLVVQQQIWDVEEEQILSEVRNFFSGFVVVYIHTYNMKSLNVEQAQELLFISREERLTTVELADLVMLWEELVSIKEKRYGPEATALADLMVAG